MENLEFNVPRRAIVITRHVILVRAHVLLVDENVDIQEYPAVQVCIKYILLRNINLSELNFKNRTGATEII
jgi:hypothetical protein